MAVALAAGGAAPVIAAITLTGLAVMAWNQGRRLAVAAEDAHTAVGTYAALLASATRNAHSAALAKDRFLANMSHELRTPLNAIVGYTELVLEDLHPTGPPETVRDLRSVEAAAGHLLELISGILDLTRLDSGDIEPEVQCVDVAEVVQTAVLAVRPELGRGHHALALDGPAQAALHTDATLLRQILINLLGNAAKFTDNGVVRVRWSMQHNGLLMEVEDSGPGISTEDLDRIFDRFEQVDPSSTRTRGGAGLGLAVTRRLVELLGGELTVRSDVGVGTTFAVLVPDLVQTASAA